MLIIDAFPFYNEYDLLYYRLSILNDTVDYFILVEATRTYTGNEKTLFYNDVKNTPRFAPFSHKIIHIINDQLEKKPFVPLNQLSSFDNKFWKNEILQRNSIAEGITQLGDKITPDDVIVISDLDEIPNRLIFRSLKEVGDFTKATGGFPIVSLDMDVYYYNLTCKKENEEWIFPKIMTLSFYHKIGTPQNARMFHNNNAKNGLLGIMKNAGWHLSYFGEPEQIQNKIMSFSHQEFNNDKYTNLEYIKEKVENKECIFNRHFDKITYIPISSNNRLPFEYETYLAKYII